MSSSSGAIKSCIYKPFPHSFSECQSNESAEFAIFYTKSKKRGLDRSFAPKTLWFSEKIVKVGSVTDEYGCWCCSWYRRATCGTASTLWWSCTSPRPAKFKPLTSSYHLHSISDTGTSIHTRFSADAEGPARRAASRPSCCTLRRTTLSVNTDDVRRPTVDSTYGGRRTVAKYVPVQSLEQSSSKCTLIFCKEASNFHVSLTLQQMPRLLLLFRTPVWLK